MSGTQSPHRASARGLGGRLHRALLFPVARRTLAHGGARCLHQEVV
ncbi:hypothetical protein [Edwardsiella anguillarum]